ncbi:helix-turn-helix domain-containing protein [Bacillus subtilis]|uniref:helix-turn-helix domain-containing protein n=1 Tax=Bacillus subtilis TaxID=1423 RepID=UPI00240E69A4|nr:helix-turn-helix transcriptional regulator [Bacillus subtilis]WEZ22072.1 helix-turn-helix transcriptional regulator [Bacillus subtilis]
MGEKSKIDMNKEIGHLIRKTREDKKIRAIDLAEKVGVSTATISNIENGKIGKRISVIQTIINILDQLGIDYDNDEEIMSFISDNLPNRNKKKNDEEQESEKDDSETVPRNYIVRPTSTLTSPVIGDVTRFKIEIKTYLGVDEADLDDSIQESMDELYEIEHDAIKAGIREFFTPDRLEELTNIINDKAKQLKEEKLKSEEKIQELGWEV